MYFPITLQFCLQYQTNAEYLISSQSITSKSAVTIPNNFFYVCS